MTVYIDKDFKCHASESAGTTAFDVPFFDDKCVAFIEGYRYIPKGHIWVDSDGCVFFGEMIAPWKDYRELDVMQREYEKKLLAEYEQLINDLYSEVAAE